MDRLPRTSLLTRVLSVNAAVLVLAAAILAVTPVTVSAPIILTEAVVVVGGLTVMLVLNLFLLQRAFAPLRRLATLMRRVDPLHPGERIPIYGDDAEVVKLTEAFNEMLDRLESERRESTRRTLAAQEAERLRIARELHDEVGQTLTAVLLQLDRASRRLPEETRAELVGARETARASMEDVRRIAQRLRPEALDDLGLSTALAILSERIAERTGVRVERDLPEEIPPLGAEAELVVYRIAQEALTNALRHANASRVELSLEARSSEVTLRVADDGRGLDGPSARAGGGIRGMHERALLVGGRLAVETPPEGGVEVRLQVPLPTAPEAAPGDVAPADAHVAARASREPRAEGSA